MNTKLLLSKWCGGLIHLARSSWPVSRHTTTTGWHGMLDLALSILKED